MIIMIDRRGEETEYNFPSVEKEENLKKLWEEVHNKKIKLTINGKTKIIRLADIDFLYVGEEAFKYKNRNVWDECLDIFCNLKDKIFGKASYKNTYK